MSEKLQQAIASIKSGNKQLGQQLLAQILQVEPSNELAWLWMSAVVDEGKRKYCIERVLKINPNHLAAKQALEKLNQIVVKEEPLPSATSQIFTPQSMNIKQDKFSNEDPLNLTDTPFPGTITSEKPTTSIAKLAITDGLKTGLLGGILGLPLVIIAGILKNSQVMDWAIIFAISILFSSGIVTGIIYFRRKLGHTLTLSVGGALSGFFSGGILSLGIGISVGMIPMLYNTEAFSASLLLCGIVIPMFSAIFNAITVWLPGIFIRQNKKVLSNLEKANLQIHEEAINAKKYGDLKRPLPPPVQPIDMEISSFQTKSNKEFTPITPPSTAARAQTNSLPIISSDNNNNRESLPVETKQHSPIISSLPQFWINPTRKGSYIFVLFNEKMFTAKCEQKHNLEVATKLSLGEIPADLLTEKVNIPYSKLIKVEEVSNSLKIEFNDQGDHAETIRVECKDQETTTDIVSAIQQKLGSEFERTVAPMSASSILLGNGILITTILGLSALFFYGATDIQNNGVPEGGSARTRGIVAIVELLGPGGVACIGGGLFLLVLFSMISSLIKPPLVTTFSRRNIYSIKKAESIQRSELPIETQTTPNAAAEKETSSPFAAALSDGLLVGLIGGLIGLPLPILYILTKNSSFNNIGMAVDLLIFLFTGIAIGILFYGRKLQRGTAAIAVGGSLGGAIAGTIFGFVYILSALSSSDISSMEGMAGNEFSIAIITSIFVAVSTSVFSAGTAWIPGLFIKSDPNIKPYDWRDSKTEAQVARIENAQKNYAGKFKTRIIFGGIAIAIIFFISLCQSLLNN